MKKIKFYAYAGAIALLSTVGFTACSSEDDVAEVNPTYDGTNVRTDFAFSITKASGKTRMTADNVQESATNNFLGIKEMFLLPFTAKPGTTNGIETNVANFYLGSLSTTDVYSGELGRSNTTSSKVYSLTLPIHTNNFLFYGVANNSNTNFQKGSVTRYGLDVPTQAAPSAIVNIHNIHFRLNSITTSLGDDSTLILNYLNKVAKTTNWAGTVDLAKNDGSYKALADLYNKFIANEQPRAGSAEAVTRTILDLYRSAKAINGNSSVSAIQNIANAICAKIDEPVGGVKVVVDHSNTDPELWTASITGIHDATFPAGTLNLPMGAAQLIWNGSEFDYNEFPYNFGPSTDNKEVAKYRYPSELIYYASSPLRASEQYRTADQYPKTAANWDATGSMTDNSGFNLSIWNKNEVTPATRAVAMQNNVNYGVALLQTNVKLGTITSGNTGFEDNRGAVIGTNLDSDNQTNIDATQFQVTGILIGGQPSRINWDMTNPSDDFDYVIYDKDIAFAGTNLSTSFFAVNNYTTVFDNLAADVEDNNDQKPVRIALEIKNGNQDFYGCNGLIPANHTFYLVGELDPSTGTASVKPSYHGSAYRLTNEDTERVFKQDYKTIVNLTISEDALKGAYSTIPDLRATEIVFGLSVDLKWEAGMQFNVEL